MGISTNQVLLQNIISNKNFKNLPRFPSLYGYQSKNQNLQTSPNQLITKAIKTTQVLRTKIN